MQRLDRRRLGRPVGAETLRLGSGTRLRLARDGFKRCKNGHASAARATECRWCWSGARPSPPIHLMTPAEEASRRPSSTAATRSSRHRTVDIGLPRARSRAMPNLVSQDGGDAAALISNPRWETHCPTSRTGFRLTAGRLQVLAVKFLFAAVF